MNYWNHNEHTAGQDQHDLSETTMINNGDKIHEYLYPDHTLFQRHRQGYKSHVPRVHAHELVVSPPKYFKIFCARWKGAFLVQGNWCGGRLYPILQFLALGLM